MPKIGRKKTELEEAYEDISQVKDLLEEAYTPEASREDLAEAVGKALGLLEDYESEETDDENSN